MNIQKVSLKQRVVQAEGNIVSLMGEEKVMFNVKNSKYYNLGEIGGEIWDMIATPITISELIASLLVKYNVEQFVCEQQVLAFIEHLAAEKLITVNENHSVFL